MTFVVSPVPKILFLHWGTRGGGPQMQASLGKHLRGTGADFCASYDAHSEVSDSLREAATEQLVVGRTSATRWRRHLLRLLSQPTDTVRLVRFCRANRVNVVFEIMDHPLQVFPRWVLRRSGVRVLTSVHDSTRHAGEESRLLTYLGERSRRDTDGIVTYSSSVASELRAASAPVFETVHGAFGSERATPPRTLPQHGITIGFFGRIERYKGLERLVAAVEDLTDQQFPVTLRVVGRGTIDAGLTQRLSNLDATVRNEWIAEEEIESIIGAFDVLCLPYDEASQSGVVGFAMRQGVPIVATPVGGLREQVVKAGGIVSASLSRADYSAAIRQVISSPSLYSDVSSSQLVAASTTYSWARVAKDIRAAAKHVVQ